MKSAGDLVGVVVELAACVEHGHDDLGCRDAFLRMDVNRNAAPVILNADRAVLVDPDVNVLAVAGQRLIDGVVHSLVDHVMKSRAVIGVADVHSRSLAYGIQSLENLDAGSVISIFCHNTLSERSRRHCRP